MIGFKTFLLIATYYFFSGLPLGFFYTFLPVQLRANGVELSTIGFLSLAGLSWSLKPFWAPFMDRYLSKMTWMRLFLLLLSFFFIGFSLNQTGNFVFFGLLFWITLSSSLYDTALDGWFIEVLPKERHGQANGLRITSYRLALIISGGVATALSQFVSSNFIIATWGLLFLGVAFFPTQTDQAKLSPSPNLEKERTNLLSLFLYPLKDLINLKGGGLLLLFVFIYKMGDALLGGMVYPFWVDRGFSKAEIGLIAGSLGTVFTILGALSGGQMTGKLGLRRSLLGFGFLQAFSNLFYGFSALPGVPKEMVYLSSVVESFTGGLGTAAFITLLTTICKKEFASSQYAILSMLFSLSTSISRSLSGILADSLGYALFFFLTFFVAIFPLLLIPYLKMERGREAR